MVWDIDCSTVSRCLVRTHPQGWWKILTHTAVEGDRTAEEERIHCRTEEGVEAGCGDNPGLDSATSQEVYCRVRVAREGCLIQGRRSLVAVIDRASTKLDCDLRGGERGLLMMLLALCRWEGVTRVVEDVSRGRARTRSRDDDCAKVGRLSSGRGDAQTRDEDSNVLRDVAPSQGMLLCWGRSRRVELW